MSIDKAIKTSTFFNSFIRNKNLSNNEKLLFEILCSYDINKKGWCQVSVDRLSEDMQLTPQSTRNILNQLTKIGLVIIVYTQNSGGLKTPIFVLNILYGISIADKQRLSQLRDSSIRNKISGLSFIKLKTHTGVKELSINDFNLELLVTGEIGNITTEVIEGELTENSNNRETVLTTKPMIKKIRNKTLDSDYNNTNIYVRIEHGNYTNVTAKILTEYFQHIYKKAYPGEVTVVDSMRDVSVINKKLKEFELDDVVKMIELLVYKYKDNFYTVKFPRPKLVILSYDWIFNSILNLLYSENDVYEAEQKYASPEINRLQETNKSAEDEEGWVF